MVLQAQVCGLFSILPDIFIKHKENKSAMFSYKGGPRVLCSLTITTNLEQFLYVLLFGKTERLGTDQELGLIHVCIHCGRQSQLPLTCLWNEVYGLI